MLFLNLIPVLVTVCGAYFIFRLRAFFMLHPIKTFKRAIRNLSSENAYRSFSLALAGTLGVGNIVGVAFGISVGGAGTVFWMLVSSVFSSVIKYCESLMSADLRQNKRGGMMYVIHSVFSKYGRILSGVYAVLCLLLAFIMGAAIQSGSIADIASAAFSVEPIFFAVLLSLFVCVIVFFGIKKIESITALTIPAAAVLYVIMCLCLIFVNISRLPSVIADILTGAFSFKSITIGVGSFGFISAIREGFSRGLLSNEAGAGTSAMAESRADSSSAVDVGLLGMLEVFFDTAVLCTITGLAILSSQVTEKGGITVVISAMAGVFGNLAAPMLFVIISAFAYSTIVCWYYYGAECVYFLFKKENSLLYSLFFIAAILIGTRIDEDFLIYATDYILFFMSVITLVTLIKKSERIVTLSEKSGLLKKSYTRKKFSSRAFK